MKQHNIVKLLSFILLSFGILTSCKKDTIVDNANQVGISKVTYFADLSLTGPQYMSVVQGQTYTESGATATQSGKTLTVTTTGTVNTAQVGIYTITYSAVNSDGFPASTSRTVAVIPSAEPPGTDISGAYYYVAGATSISTVTKLAPGFYSTDNCYSNATTIACQFICSDGATITIPAQTTAYGGLNGTGTLTPTGTLTYVLNLTDQGISNRARVWQKK